MDVSKDIARLYVPYYSEREGASQPLATALPLDAGKHLCLHHFLKRCRTMQQRLPSEQRAEISVTLLDKIHLAWSQNSAGIYAGQSEGCLATPLASMTSITYKLLPVEG